MDNKSIFNATICIIGIAFLLIHTIDILLKKDRRKDENNLLLFIVFTMVHFATYLTFTLIKVNYSSNPLIIGFYTTFYIMNNIEAVLLFAYTVNYISAPKKVLNIVTIINLSVFGVFVILDIVNIFTHIFFYADNASYVRADAMFVSQIYQFVGLAMVLILTAFNKKLKTTEKIAFAIYCVLPLVAIILQNAFSGYAIAYLSIIISIEILFLFVNVRRNIELVNEARKNKEAEVMVMMSQIQPHFIYNTLASISTLIKIDPDKAQKGLDAFTEYLRANLSSLTQNGLIPFSNELRHIETYLELEKMRFDERLIINYDIKVKDFLVPPLSVQPIVENAVKHGILKKIEGGTITIKTFEDNNAYIVQISDDGVGFDTKSFKDDENIHIGINNVRFRISSMCHGDMEIESEIDKGTKVTVKFYK